MICTNDKEKIILILKIWFMIWNENRSKPTRIQIFVVYSTVF